MKLYIQAVCSVGKVRTNNEDMISVGGVLLRDDSLEITVDVPEKDGLFYLLVSDGMGGHEMGEFASEYTLSQLKEFFDSGDFGTDFPDALREKVKVISDNLNAMAAARGMERPWGCTLTGYIWAYGKVYVVNAGDSRTYRYRDDILRQLTVDENERGMTHSGEGSKLLLNCIGGGSYGRLVVQDMSGKVLKGDKLLVCSDGLTDMAEEWQIEEELSFDRSHPADDLLEDAEYKGGADNISIIVAKIDEPFPPEEEDFPDENPAWDPYV